MIHKRKGKKTNESKRELELWDNGTMYSWLLHQNQNSMRGMFDDLNITNFRRATKLLSRCNMN